MDNGIGNNKIKIAAVVGPTASGKTALSIELAKRFDGEIISCDSMQIYKGMDIGTAKPTEEEKCGIPHHMIDVCDPLDIFNCSDYAEMAEKCIYDVISRGKLPIFCGGTGLYLDSVLRGVRNDGAEKDDDFRNEMLAFYNENGAEALHAKLRQIDPESAESIHPNNVKRVIRALEVYHTTGKTKTQLDAESLVGGAKFDALVVGLDYGNRDILYSRTDKRVDIMMADGLLDEVKRLYEGGKLPYDSTAGQAIGYKELIKYFEGGISLEEAVELIKLGT